MFAIQDEIAAAVVDALKISLLGEVAKVEEINPEAYALYLQGKHFYARYTKEGVEKAVDAYRRALALDPLNLAAYSNLGLNLTAAGRLEEAAAAFRHALELDPQSPYAHFHLGRIFLLQNQPQLALAEMEREIDPILRDLGTVLALSALGRKADAEQALAVFIEEHGRFLSRRVTPGVAMRTRPSCGWTWPTSNATVISPKSCRTRCWPVSNPIRAGRRSSTRWVCRTERDQSSEPKKNWYLCTENCKLNPALFVSCVIPAKAWIQLATGID